LKAEEARLYARAKSLEVDLGDVIDPTERSGYMHRVVKGVEPDRGPGDPSLPGTDFLVGGPVGELKRGIPTSAPSLEQRSLFAIENRAGDRRVVSIDADGNLRTWSGGKPGQTVDGWAPTKGSAQPKVGEIIEHDGQPWRFSTAFTREIEAETPYRYNKSAFANTAENVQRLRGAVRNAELLKEIKSTEWFQQNSTRAGSNLHPEGWKTPKNPNFNGYVMEPRIAEALDDFAGIQRSGIENSLAAANRYFVQAMFWSPLVHATNVALHAVVSRGWGNFNPTNVPSRARGFQSALESVTTQDATFKAFLRDGGALISGSLDNAKFYEQLLNKFGQGLDANPEVAANMARSAGFPDWKTMKLAMQNNPVSNGVSNVYKWSNRSLWTTGDVFMLERYQELVAKGYSSKAAIKEIERHVPNYRIPERVLESRLLSHAFQNPAIAQFSRYHYGRLRSWGAALGDAFGLGRATTAAQQMDGVGALFATYVLWEGLQGANTLLRGKFGDEKKAPKLIGFGPLAVVEAAEKVQNGTADVTSLAQLAFGLAPATKFFIEQWANRNLFTGKAIRTRDMDESMVQASIRQTAQSLDHLLRLGVQPYQAADGAWKDMQTDESIPSALVKMLGAASASGLGVYNAATPERREATARRYGRAEHTRRMRKPEGPVEAGGNRLSEWVGEQMGLDKAVGARTIPKKSSPYGGPQ